jgi:hypothetical protein
LRANLLDASPWVFDRPHSTLASVIEATLHTRNHDANEPGRRRRSSQLHAPSLRSPTREASIRKEPEHTSGRITPSPTTRRLSGRKAARNYANGPLDGHRSP